MPSPQTADAAARRARARRARRRLRPRARHRPPAVPAHELRHGGGVPRHEPRLRPLFAVDAGRGRRPGRRRRARAPLAHAASSSTCRRTSCATTSPGPASSRSASAPSAGTRCCARRASRCSAIKLENYLKEVFLDSDTHARARELRARRRSREHDPHQRPDGARARARERPRRDAAAASATPSSARASRAGSTSIDAPRPSAAVRTAGRATRSAIRSRRRSGRGAWTTRSSSTPATSACVKRGIRIVCVHKGLVPPDYEKTFPNWAYAHGRRRGQGGARLAGAHVRHLPLGAEAVPDLARREPRRSSSARAAWTG